MHIVAFFQTLSTWPKNETPDTHVTKMTPNVTVKNLIGTENYVHNLSPYFLKAQNETPKTKLQKKTYILTIPSTISFLIKTGSSGHPESGKLKNPFFLWPLGGAVHWKITRLTPSRLKK
jgi:hypothetical protein